MALSILSEQFCIPRPRQVTGVGRGWSWDELRTSESRQPTWPAPSAHKRLVLVHQVEPHHLF